MTETERLTEIEYMVKPFFIVNYIQHFAKSKIGIEMVHEYVLSKERIGHSPQAKITHRQGSKGHQL